MRKKRSTWEWICITGIPQASAMAIAFYYLMRQWYQTWYHRVFIIRNISNLRQIIICTGFFWLYVVLKNLLWLNTSKKIGFFTWLDKFKNEPAEVSMRKRKAQYPDIPEELLSDAPEGFVLGKKGKKYIRLKLKKGNILNAIIMGSTGCGKSVLLLTMLLYQFHHKPKPKEEFTPMVFYCLDIKPELAQKSCRIKGNKMVHVMNPLDRFSYGWDVFYKISPNDSTDDIMSEMDLIARALIDEGKGNEKNKFFYKHAQTIMKAILFYMYKTGKTFMQGIIYITTGSISDVINKTMDAIGDKSEYSLVRRLLSPYIGKEGEAFEGIELAFRQSLDIFNKEAVQFFFDGNPRKASPLDLEDKISVFFSIHENIIEEYSTILRLTTMQVMAHCKERPEDAHMLTLIIDEAARLGAINWTDFLATSRSHQICTILAFQGISQMQSVWSKEDAKTLIELCRVVTVLSCADPDMARVLSDWAGDYTEQKHSTNNGGKNDGTYSTSYEDKKILTQADIMSLQDNEEAVAFIKGQYLRFNVTKARYYKIPELNRISEECVAFNEVSE